MCLSSFLHTPTSILCALSHSHCLLLPYSHYLVPPSSMPHHSLCFPFLPSLVGSMTTQARGRSWCWRRHLRFMLPWGPMMRTSARGWSRQMCSWTPLSPPFLLPAPLCSWQPSGAYTPSPDQCTHSEPLFRWACFVTPVILPFLFFIWTNRDEQRAVKQSWAVKIFVEKLKRNMFI